MNVDEARTLIIDESINGIAYTSRMGEYPDREHFDRIISALRIIHNENKGNEFVDRRLFCALFILGDQVQGNFTGALSKNIKVPGWFRESGIVLLLSALYAIFEDHDEFD